MQIYHKTANQQQSSDKYPQQISLEIDKVQLKPIAFISRKKINNNNNPYKNKQENSKLLKNKAILTNNRNYQSIYDHIRKAYQANNNNHNTNKKQTQKHLKKVLISPNKIMSYQHILEAFQPIRKQLESLKEDYFLKETNQNHTQPFCIAIKEIGTYKEKKNKDSLESPAYRSIKIEKKKKLKPISEVYLKKDQTNFFNVEKANFYEVSSKNANSQKNQSGLVSRLSETEADIMAPSKKIVVVSHQRSKPKISMQYCKQNMNNTCKNNSKEDLIEEENKSKSISMKKKISLSINNIQDQIQNSKKQEPKQMKMIEKYGRVRKKDFNPSFGTYYYRDLLWKINFTNNLSVEIPLEYQHRLKAYVGKGNNSSLIKGLIKRRIWIAFTDRIEQANFIWTQLKSLSYFKKQNLFKENIHKFENSNYVKGSIMSSREKQIYQNYFNTYLNFEERTDERLLNRHKYFKFQRQIKCSQIKESKIHNHLINNYVIGNKKALFHTMSAYYNQIGEQVFKYLPLSFHIRQGLEDEQYFKFLKIFYKKSREIKANKDNTKKEHNAWIIKPGENSNRGKGITVCLNLEDIKTILRKKQKYLDGSYQTYILQSYIEKPMLYFKRKFDIRHYIMMTCINGIVKGYWYRDGYIRTTSNEYTLKNGSGQIHLTNDAVQKNLPEYGKYEKGNKISYDELSNYLDKYYKGYNFYNNIYPKMKKIATDTIKACSGSIDPQKLNANFEIFGLDFMIDSSANVWLIQVNSNPCLEINCPLLGSIIPRMIQNSLQLIMDSTFPPPVRFCPKGVHYFKNLEQENRFELVYDERIDGLYDFSSTVLDAKLLDEQDDTFDDDGDQWNED